MIMILCSRSPEPGILSTPESGFQALSNGVQPCLAVQPVSDRCTVVSLYFLYLAKRQSVSVVYPVSEYSVTSCLLFKQPYTFSWERVF